MDQAKRPTSDTSPCKNQRYKRICGRGGIGRHVGFRFQWISVQVQVLSPVPEKNPHLSTTSVGSFQRNPPCRVGEIIFDDEIPCGDKIRPDGGWVDLILSTKQISSEQRLDFIAQSAISLCIVIGFSICLFRVYLCDRECSRYLHCKTLLNA